MANTNWRTEARGGVSKEECAARVERRYDEWLRPLHAGTSSAELKRKISNLPYADARVWLLDIAEGGNLATETEKLSPAGEFDCNQLSNEELFDYLFWFDSMPLPGDQDESSHPDKLTIGELKDYFVDRYAEFLEVGFGPYGEDAVQELDWLLPYEAHVILTYLGEFVHLPISDLTDSQIVTALWFRSAKRS